MSHAPHKGERRKWPRWPRRDITALVSVRLQSEEVQLINASRNGILIECGIRLPPGAASEPLFYLADGPVRVRGLVVRSEVISIQKNRLHYRVAIAFSNELTFVDGATQPSPTMPKFGPDTRMVAVLNNGGEIDAELALKRNGGRRPAFSK
jgi:hypothetical protein